MGIEKFVKWISESYKNRNWFWKFRIISVICFILSFFMQIPIIFEEKNFWSNVFPVDLVVIGIVLDIKLENALVLEIWLGCVLFQEVLCYVYNKYKEMRLVQERNRYMIDYFDANHKQLAVGDIVLYKGRRYRIGRGNDGKGYLNADFAESSFSNDLEWESFEDNKIFYYRHEFVNC